MGIGGTLDARGIRRPVCHPIPEPEVRKRDRVILGHCPRPFHPALQRALSFRAILDYSTVDRDSTLSRVEPEHRWVTDLLFTYLVHPGAALYVGYTGRYENLRLLPGSPPALERSDSPGMSVGRQAFVKLSYLWRF